MATSSHVAPPNAGGSGATAAGSGVGGAVPPLHPSGTTPPSHRRTLGLHVQTAGLPRLESVAQGGRTPPLFRTLGSEAGAPGAVVAPPTRSNVPSYLASSLTPLHHAQSFVGAARAEAAKEQAKADAARQALLGGTASNPGTPHHELVADPTMGAGVMMSSPAAAARPGFRHAGLTHNPTAAASPLIGARALTPQPLPPNPLSAGTNTPFGFGASPPSGTNDGVSDTTPLLTRGSSGNQAGLFQRVATPGSNSGGSAKSYGSAAGGVGMMRVGPDLAISVADPTAAGSSSASASASASAAASAAGTGAAVSMDSAAVDSKGQPAYLFLASSYTEDEDLKEFQEPPLSALAHFRWAFLVIGMFAGRHADEEEDEHSTPRAFQQVYSSVSAVFVLINTCISCWVAWYEPSTTLKLIIQMLQLAAWAGSFGLCYDMLTSRRIELLTFLAIRNTSAKSKVRTEINFALYGNVAMLVVIAAIGAAADIVNIRELMAQPNMLPLQHMLGSTGILLWQFTAITTNLQLAAGMCIFATVANLHMCRVNSCIRALDRSKTDIAHALDRVLDIDVSLAHFGYKSASLVNVMFVSHFLKFFLSSMIRATAASFLGNAPFVVLVQAIVHPGSICLYFLSSAGVLNQQALYLTKVCVRFYVKHANDANTKNLKDFLEFVKAGDFCMRFNGIRVELADAWKLVAIASSFFFTLLQMQSKASAA